MKREDDKAKNVFKEYNSVTLTKSSDEEKRRVHEYCLHNKERIMRRHKGGKKLNRHQFNIFLKV